MRSFGAGQFKFVGYPGRKRAKLTWPLVLVNITLAQAVETFIADSLKLDFNFHYIAAPRNVRGVSYAPLTE